MISNLFIKTIQFFYNINKYNSFEYYLESMLGMGEYPLENTDVKMPLEIETIVPEKENKPVEEKKEEEVEIM